MRFFIDRCAGRRLAEWLRDAGHDVVEARLLGPDPGDAALLELAAADNRILVTIDTDFGELIYLRGIAHTGLVRLPNTRVAQRIVLMSAVIERYQQTLEAQAIVTVSGGRIRVSHYP